MSQHSLCDDGFDALFGDLNPKGHQTCNCSNRSCYPARCFIKLRSASAVIVDDAGFCPVTRRPSTTQKGYQSSVF